MIRNLSFFLSLSVLLFLFSCKNDDDALTTGDLEVEVLTDNDLGVVGITVQTNPETSAVITDESAKAFFTSIPVGNYTVFINSEDGQRIVEKEVQVSANEITKTTLIVEGITDPDVIEPDFDIKLLVDKAYKDLQGTLFFDATGYSLYWGDIGVDSSYLYDTSDPAIRDLDNYLIDPGNAMVNNVWTAYYQFIQTINIGLDYLAEPMDESLTENEIIGFFAELRFLRALAYFNLVKIYGNPIISTTAAIDVNNPINLEQDQEKLYQVIIDDLVYAESNLSENQNKALASSSAASALLGKVYLKMAGYPMNATEMYANALEQFNKLDGVYTLEINYEDLFDPEKENQLNEVIFKILFGSTANEGGNYGAIWGPLGVAVQDQLRLTTSFVSDYFKDASIIEEPVQFPIENEDSRFFQNIATFKKENDMLVEQSELSEWRPYKYQKDDSESTALNGEEFDFSYLRYADILLGIAEAENALRGPSVEAYEAINKVRRRAFGNNLNDLPNGLSSEEFVNAILKERLLEFCFEGKRKDDLVRFDKLEEIIQAFNDENPSRIRDFQEYEYIWPIPRIELDVNPNVIQNPGY